MKARKFLYVEGGGDSKELHTRCREGFRKLLEKCGYKGKMPRLFACGGRESAFDDFKRALKNRNSGDYVAMMIDSEDPLTDIEAAWKHLKKRDNWNRPSEADDDQVLFMTTCMETWIVADRETLSKHYGSNLQVSALPPLAESETRSRHDIQDKLDHATRNCPNAFRKGKRSFEVLSKLSPEVLKLHLPSFCRNIEILNEKLLDMKR